MKEIAKSVQQSERDARDMFQTFNVLSLRMITTLYPVMHWAMDIVHHLLSSWKRHFLLMITDYTKWMEENTFIQITDPKVHNFV